MTTILVVPGLGGSGPEHWQSRWERSDARAMRVEQRSWDRPRCSEWCATLASAAQNVQREVVLVAHSLGAILIAHWVAQATVSSLQKVKGALLVAPPDVESLERVPAIIQHFGPVPRERLPFPSIVVASRNDEYADIAVPRALASAWGARFVDVGERGHINADSGLGDWEEGRALLETLL